MVNRADCSMAGEVRIYIMRLFLIILFMVVLSSCVHQYPMPVIPPVYVAVSNKGFALQQGILYLNGQPFSGHQYALRSIGDTAMVVPFYKGREYGMARQWYENGQLKEVRFFVNGQKTGEHTGWWQNGQLQFVYHFSNDMFEGMVKEWYANGRLFRQMHYAAGTENGLQQIWQPDGKLFANYEARDGRNYGLTGTMHCKNYRNKVVTK